MSEPTANDFRLPVIGLILAFGLIAVAGVFADEYRAVWMGIGGMSAYGLLGWVVYWTIRAYESDGRGLGDFL